MTEVLKEKIETMASALLQLRELERVVTHLKESARTLDGRVWGDRLKNKLSESADNFVQTECPHLAKDNYKVYIGYGCNGRLQMTVNIRGYRQYSVFMVKSFDTYMSGIPMRDIFTFYKDKKTGKLLKYTDYEDGEVKEPHALSSFRYFSSVDFINCLDSGLGGKTLEAYIHGMADGLEKGIKTLEKDLTELQEAINRYNSIINSMGFLEREILGIRDLSPVYGSNLPHLGYKIKF